MKKWNQFLMLGIAGLLVSLILFLVMRLLGINYDSIPYVLPWIVFLIIGLAKREYVKN